MSVLWRNGPLTIHELQALFHDRLHFNTLSTYIRGLEKHGYVRHSNVGFRPYVYEALMTQEEYLDIMIARLKSIFTMDILSQRNLL